MREILGESPGAAGGIPASLGNEPNVLAFPERLHFPAASSSRRHSKGFFDAMSSVLRGETAQRAAASVSSASVTSCHSVSLSAVAPKRARS